MLILNGSMQFIRCSRYEYLIKKGSISNYSFNIKDEEKTGILEVLFEKTSFPITKENLFLHLKGKKEESDSEIKNIVNKLVEIEVLLAYNEEKYQKQPICIITEDGQLVKDVFLREKFQISIISDTELKMMENDEKKANSFLQDFEYLVLFKNHFSPSTFYMVNKLCLNYNKKLIISYLDGQEGIIIPLLNVAQVGCYNDFEILRESSFYNLLDYQVMKERLLKQENNQLTSNPLHFNMLVHQTVLLLNHFTRYSYMNYYAYSLDFERMVNTKTRLLKFPKCPTCQSDKNLVHAFI